MGGEESCSGPSGGRWWRADSRRTCMHNKAAGGVGVGVQGPRGAPGSCQSSSLTRWRAAALVDRGGETLLARCHQWALWHLAVRTPQVPSGDSNFPGLVLRLLPPFVALCHSAVYATVPPATCGLWPQGLGRFSGGPLCPFLPSTVHLILEINRKMLARWLLPLVCRLSPATGCQVLARCGSLKKDPPLSESVISVSLLLLNRSTLPLGTCAARTSPPTLSP